MYLVVTRWYLLVSLFAAVLLYSCIDWDVKVEVISIMSEANYYVVYACG